MKRQSWKGDNAIHLRIASVGAVIAVLIALLSIAFL
jgi:hypothetical protein